MTQTVTARYDGKVLIPDQALDIATGDSVRIVVETLDVPRLTDVEKMELLLSTSGCIRTNIVLPPEAFKANLNGAG
jgi:predicted DNA-binding antitoxin AbrB/MazE fold protein